MANTLLSRLSILTALFIVFLSLIIPSVLAAAPVWTNIPDQSIGAGNLLTFTVAATDADGDIMRLSIEVEGFNYREIGIDFTDNGNGTGRFTWTPNASQSRVYDVIFIASTGEGELVETDLETARITVTQPAAVPSLSPEEQEYNDLVAEFNDLDDEYSLNKRRYERAVDDDDERDIDDYAEKLEDVDDDLADLEDDTEDLLNDVEDSNLSNRRELADDIEDVQDDIERVRDRIDTLLNEEDNTAAGTVVNTYTPPAPRVEPQPARTRVVIGTLDFPGGNVPNTMEQPQDNGRDTLKMVWIGAGIVVLIAVIVFLVALMLV